MAGDEIKPTAHPPLNLPQSNSTVEVSIINTTTDIVVPAKAFVEPVQKGHEFMNMPTFAFLVENKKLDKTIMFDLGCRKDWWNLSPAGYSSVAKGQIYIYISMSSRLRDFYRYTWSQRYQKCQ